MLFRKGVLLVASIFLILSGAKATSSAESECSGIKIGQKIWWDGVELKAGQIGRLLIKSDTPLYKPEGEKKEVVRTLKAGTAYRIYAFKPGKLSVGGGLFVDRDHRITYETPSKSKLALVACANPTNTPKELPNTIHISEKIVDGQHSIYYENKNTNKEEKLVTEKAYLDKAVQLGDWVYLIVTTYHTTNFSRINIHTKAQEILFNEQVENFIVTNEKLFILTEEYYMNEDHMWISGRDFSIYEMNLGGKQQEVVNEMSVYNGELYPETFSYFNGNFYILTSNLSTDGTRETSISKYSKDHTNLGVVFEITDHDSESFITYTKGSAIIMESIAKKGKIIHEYNPDK
jgi:hypothetical protein